MIHHSFPNFSKLSSKFPHEKFKVPSVQLLEIMRVSILGYSIFHHMKSRVVFLNFNDSNLSIIGDSGIRDMGVLNRGIWVALYNWFELQMLQLSKSQLLKLLNPTTDANFYLERISSIMGLNFKR
jgi:hypothetical protein